MRKARPERNPPHSRPVRRAPRRTDLANAHHSSRTGYPATPAEEKRTAQHRRSLSLDPRPRPQRTAVDRRRCQPLQRPGCGADQQDPPRHPAQGRRERLAQRRGHPPADGDGSAVPRYRQGQPGLPGQTAEPRQTDGRCLSPRMGITAPVRSLRWPRQQRRGLAEAPGGQARDGRCLAVATGQGRPATRATRPVPEKPATAARPGGRLVDRQPSSPAQRGPSRQRLAGTLAGPIQSQWCGARDADAKKRPPAGSSPTACPSPAPIGAPGQRYARRACSSVPACWLGGRPCCTTPTSCMCPD